MVKNGILKNKVNPRMKMLVPWHSRPLLIISQHYLKISLMMRIKIQSCLMAKNVKVNSPNSSDDELDKKDEVASLISQYGKKGATKIMKLMMKVDELE